MGARIGAKYREIQKSRVEKSGIKLQSLTEQNQGKRALVRKTGSSKNRDSSVCNEF